jgi:hypothetical protein
MGTSVAMPDTLVPIHNGDIEQCKEVILAVGDIVLLGLLWSTASKKAFLRHPSVSDTISDDTRSQLRSI